MITDLLVISFYANVPINWKYLFLQFANHFAFNLMTWVVMTCRQVFNEHIWIVLRETIGSVVCSFYLALSKTLDWESRMRWSVVLVFLLSLLFLSRNAVLQISTLHCVDTMSNPAPHFKAKSHTSYISFFQSAVIFCTRTWVAEIYSLQLSDSLWSRRFCFAVVHGRSTTIAVF